MSLKSAVKAASDYCICVPPEETPRIQEARIMIGHILCEIAETSLFPVE
jgi:D-sedoheptulose 7-phosphate isomerase